MPEYTIEVEDLKIKVKQPNRHQRSNWKQIRLLLWVLPELCQSWQELKRLFCESLSRCGRAAIRKSF